MYIRVTGTGTSHTSDIMDYILDLYSGYITGIQYTYRELVHHHTTGTIYKLLKLYTGHTAGGRN